MILRDCCEQPCGNKMDNLGEMDKFLRKAQLYITEQGRNGNYVNQITSTEIQTVIKTFSHTKEVQDQMASQEKSIKHLEKS